jgi:hypothetical protein
MLPLYQPLKIKIAIQSFLYFIYKLQVLYYTTNGSAHFAYKIKAYRGQLYGKKILLRKK